MAKDKITLREFITELEKLADNGKNDNIRVVYQNSDEECYNIDCFGVGEVYPANDLANGITDNGEKCLIIQAF